MTRLVVRTDCWHYVGDKPCRYNRLCEGCPYFSPRGTKVLVIKLGAMGDVLRTTTLLPALRAKYDPCHVTWVSDPPGVELLRGNPLVDRLLPCDLGTALRLSVERFDVAIALDKEDRATALIARTNAPVKLGFGMDEHGGVRPLNPGADYAFSLGLSDELKFRVNTRTYQEVTFEAAELVWRGEEYVFVLSEEEKEWGKRRLLALGIGEGERLLGLNTGAGPIFATKKWTREGFVAVARRAVRELGARVLLLGGPDETERNRAIWESLADLGNRVVDAGTDNPLRGFAAIVRRLTVLVTGDTMAMHLGIAQRVPTIAIFGPTCAQEVDLYGRGEKIVTPPPCAPCYRKECTEEAQVCMTRITPDEVFAAVTRWWGVQ